MSESEARIAALPIWSGKPALAPLLGGLSNVSFTAVDDNGKYVVRLTKDYPFHHVFRDREVMLARAAYVSGFAPEVVHAEPGVMVSRFIEGQVYKTSDVYPNLDRLAQFIRRFHNNMPTAVSGPAFLFWAFHANREYIRTLANHATEEERRDWFTLNAKLEAVQRPLPLVIGHHDLLPANFIDDGQRLWLIDYEYAGHGTAMFDIANLSSNSRFTAEQSEDLLTAYFLEPPDEALRRSHAAMECASLLREALWSLVSFNYLEAPGADYIGYARTNFERLEVALAAYRERFGDL